MQYCKNVIIHCHVTFVACFLWLQMISCNAAEGKHNIIHEALEGSDIQLPCYIDKCNKTFKTTNCFWNHDKEKVEIDGRYSYVKTTSQESGSKNCSINIKNINLEMDNGTWECGMIRSSNQSGCSYVSLHVLKVKSNPVYENKSVAEIETDETVSFVNDVFKTVHNIVMRKILIPFIISVIIIFIVILTLTFCVCFNEKQILQKPVEFLNNATLNEIQRQQSSPRQLPTLEEIIVAEMKSTLNTIRERQVESARSRRRIINLQEMEDDSDESDHTLDTSNCNIYDPLHIYINTEHKEINDEYMDIEQFENNEEDDPFYENITNDLSI